MLNFTFIFMNLFMKKNCVSYDLSGKCPNNNVRIDNAEKNLLGKEKQECG